METFIHGLANWVAFHVLLLLVVALLAAVNLTNLSFSIRRITQHAKGTRILDTYRFYDATTAYEVLGKFQAEGRQAYLKMLTQVDMILPAAYSLFLAVTITMEYRRAFPAGAWVQSLNLVPLATGFFDYLENVSLIALLVNYDRKHLPGVAKAAGYFTSIKNVLLLVSLVLVVVGIIARAF